MSDDVRALTAQLAADPSSLAFLDLADLLRRRGQLDAARTVAASGVARNPDLAEAHSLNARILADSGDGDGAFDAWMTALRLDPEEASAHKGLGFLYYRSGDLVRALRHLEAAAGPTPADSGLVAAIARVRHSAAIAVAPQSVGGPAEPSESSDRPAGMYDAPAPMPFSFETPDVATGDAELFAGLEGSRDGLLLLDQHGLRLGGAVRDPDGREVSDTVAAHLAGVSREAARAARLLTLGSWQSVSVECRDGNMHLVAPTADTILLTVREVSVPAGRLALLADRGAQAARRWLERLS